MNSIMKLQNFKCFQRQSITFRQLTLLTGVNSAGKSTIIQALLLLQQNYPLSNEASEVAEERANIQTDKRHKLQLSGALVNLGMYDDVLYANADDDTFSIELKGNTSNISLLATPDSDDTIAEWRISGSPIFEIFNISMLTALLRKLFFLFRGLSNSRPTPSAIMENLRHTSSIGMASQILFMPMLPAPIFWLPMRLEIRYCSKCKPRHGYPNLVYLYV